MDLKFSFFQLGASCLSHHYSGFFPPDFLPSVSSPPSLAAPPSWPSLDGKSDACRLSWVGWSTTAHSRSREEVDAGKIGEANNRPLPSPDRQTHAARHGAGWCVYTVMQSHRGRELTSFRMDNPSSAE